VKIGIYKRIIFFGRLLNLEWPRANPLTSRMHLRDGMISRCFTWFGGIFWPGSQISHRRLLPIVTCKIISSSMGELIEDCPSLCIQSDNRVFYSSIQAAPSLFTGSRPERLRFFQISKGFCWLFHSSRPGWKHYLNFHASWLSSILLSFSIPCSMREYM
jgi:hypothetical protein